MKFVVQYETPFHLWKHYGTYGGRNTAYSRELFFGRQVLIGIVARDSQDNPQDLTMPIKMNSCIYPQNEQRKVNLDLIM